MTASEQIKQLLPAKKKKKKYKPGLPDLCYFTKQITYPKDVR